MQDEVIKIGLKFCGVVAILVISFYILFSFITYSNIQNHKIVSNNQSTQVTQTNQSYPIK